MVLLLPTLSAHYSRIVQVKFVCSTSNVYQKQIVVQYVRSLFDGMCRNDVLPFLSKTHSNIYNNNKNGSRSMYSPWIASNKRARSVSESRQAGGKFLNTRAGRCLIVFENRISLRRTKPRESRFDVPNHRTR